MGYTHYWYRKPKVSQEKMKAIFEDFSRILPQFSNLLANWEGIGKPDISELGFSFNGIGRQAHETMSFPLLQDVPKYQAEDPELKGKAFVFCKTARKPYDIAVTSLLIIIKHHLGDDIKLSSDGTNDDWLEATVLTEKELKYKKDGVK